MTLDQAKPGQTFRIRSIDDPAARLAAIRFGIAEGSRASCEAVLPGGPVVLRKGKQEIALGRSLAHRIEVELLEG
ncbi:MAG: ferrous iron transport protein A [Symbiobacteriaceae bacterium]|nr:MAG: ferrous iron transport protein A [Bacillota bacterium]